MAPWALLSPGVLVRTGHTVLTWGITLVLFLHDTDKSADELLATHSHSWNQHLQAFAQPGTHFPTSNCTPTPPTPVLPGPASLCSPASPELRQWEEQGELLLPLTFLLLVLGSLLLYLAVSLMDPGYVNVQPQPQEELKEEQTAMVPPAIPLRRCRYCLVLQPLRARHCRECRRCVRRYDHHCPWMENCVGERNHPLFVVYLALQLVVLLWGLYLACPGVSGCGPAGSCSPPSCCCPSSRWWPACSSSRTSTWWPATPPPGNSSPHTASPISASAPATPSTEA
ncbi:palmitoyltransferase ZDHHC12 isoform X1 [Homo sapiens]|uniref:palmitoyltransferase ZDHHC12 isoform X1 n=1 Tax=Homo sapiens TaxID=9606 RepID=UPI0005D02626|nr:palmitoyltransferase ZDHHC12 isoform X1 [Homo sapiens]|eukprot:XP_011517418.1 probable palmitoyltransferase ZDHHC12 isoform X1 [Homo sapiens]